MKKALLYGAFILSVTLSWGQIRLDSGLVAYYAFCGDVSDGSGNANNGNSRGNPTYGPDRNGNPDAALVLDGVGDYVEIASSPSLERPKAQVSLALWFNTQNYFQNRWAVLLTKSDQVPLDSRQYSLYYERNGTIYFNSEIVTVEPLPLDTWHHLAVTYSDSNVIRCYLDGGLLVQDTLTDTISVNSLPLHLGRDIPGVNEFYVGSLDEVRIYDRVLRPEEVQALVTDSSNCQITSIAAGAEGQIRAYPNPGTLGWWIEAGARMPVGQPWQVYDQTGRLMESGIWKTDKAFWLEGSTWPAGVYYVRTAGHHQMLELRD